MACPNLHFEDFAVDLDFSKRFKSFPVVKIYFSQDRKKMLCDLYKVMQNAQESTSKPKHHLLWNEHTDGCYKTTNFYTHSVSGI